MVKGILLAGGTGTRLLPMTRVVNKHLLPCYDRPMVYYPLQRLIDAGCKEIMIITSDDHAGDFISLLGDGARWGAQFTYRVQMSANGIAGALLLAEGFIGKDSCLVLLGDNYFQDALFVPELHIGAKIWLKPVPDPQRFGVANITANGEVIDLVEKPTTPTSDLAVTGAYLYDHNVFSIIRTITPSARGELEITDVNKAYLTQHALTADLLEGHWQDLGTVESLFYGARKAKEHTNIWRKDILERK